jgi:hypothetical protein
VFASGSRATVSGVYALSDSRQVRRGSVAKSAGAPPPPPEVRPHIGRHARSFRKAGVTRRQRGRPCRPNQARDGRRAGRSHCVSERKRRPCPVWGSSSATGPVTQSPRLWNSDRPCAPRTTGSPSVPAHRRTALVANHRAGSTTEAASVSTLLLMDRCRDLSSRKPRAVGELGGGLGEATSGVSASNAHRAKSAARPCPSRSIGQ